MKGNCVLSSAKVRILFRIIEYFARKTFHFLRIGRERIKTCGLSFETPLLFSSFSPLFWKRRRFLRPPCPHCFLIRTAVRANGHAPAHRALSEFEILAFTLHLHPQSIDPVCFAREGNAHFSPSPGEGKRGETFTRKSLFPRCLQSYGEEVKAKNKKQRTRALRVRVGAKVGGRCTFEKGFPVVEISLQMSDELFFCNKQSNKRG